MQECFSLWWENQKAKNKTRGDTIVLEFKSPGENAAFWSHPILTRQAEATNVDHVEGVSKMPLALSDFMRIIPPVLHLPLGFGNDLWDKFEEIATEWSPSSDEELKLRNYIIELKRAKRMVEGACSVHYSLKISLNKPRICGNKRR
jgi:hypothetical protein